jgi:ligand-binding sensor domain-containing protein/anti-sigma regulatory factor (Ser/Thr protein kinase)
MHPSFIINITEINWGMHKFIIFIFFYCNCNATLAQYALPYTFKFKNYTTLNGMADNVVVKTVKDKNGFLWIATHNGISRFDGLEFKNYSHNPTDSTTLRSIWISDLLIDEQQTLWASTEWGLCYYEVAKDKFIYINDKAHIQLVSKMPLCNDTKNTIWIAAEDGLKKVNCITKKYSNTSLNRIADPQFISKDNAGNLIIGTRGRGLFKYNIVSDNYTLISTESLPVDTHYMGAYVHEGNMWIATSEGLILLHDDKTSTLFYKASRSLHNDMVTQLMCVSPFQSGVGNDYLICGTYDKKLLLFDIKQKVFTQKWTSNATNPEGFLSAVVYSIYEDNCTLWIGTDRGLNQLNLENQQQQSFYIAPLLSKENLPLIRKIINDNNSNHTKLWLIPWQPYNGIVLYDRETQKIVQEWNTNNSEGGKRYNDIIHSKFGNIILAGRDSAIDFFNEKKGLFKTIKLPDNINCLQEDDAGNFWAGGDEGLLFINAKSNKVSVFRSTFSGSDVEKNAYGGRFPVADLEIAADNKIWLAIGKYGLFCFDMTTKKFTAYRQKVNSNFSTLNRCSAIEIIAKDSIWVGNMSGLSCFIPSQDKFINYDAANGLKSTYIYSIVKDKANNIWARGNADVFCFNTHTHKLISTKLDPRSDVFSYIQRLSIDGDHLLLGHEAGFTIFNTPDFTKPIIAKPLLKILSYKGKAGSFFLESDSNINSITFKYYENQIGFDFAAIEYNYPEEIEYWYRLEGLEKDFINGAGNRTVAYNNLPHGKYRFAVYALSKHSNIKSTVAFFAFTIKPAFWQRWWFWPLIGLLFVLGVVYVARKRVAAIRQKEKQKTLLNKTMAELETKMFRSQMNPHFIFNSLNSIQKYIWENKEEDAAEYLARFAKLIRAILENSRKETIPLYEEIEVMKLYIELEHRRSNAHFDYTIKVSEDIDLQNIAIPPLLMQPFIENAIWHGLNKKKEKGNLIISVTKKEAQLICIIDDDGVGRQEYVASISTEKKSLGITITQQRIDRLMETTKLFASVTIEDKKENGIALGTTVTLTLPLQNIANA